jgi:hypothetical protein
MGQAPGVREADSFQDDRVTRIADRADVTELLPVFPCQASLHGLKDLLTGLVQRGGEGRRRSEALRGVFQSCEQLHRTPVHV